MRYAQMGCMVDPDHTFRRLATCAVEDVGLGNLLAVGMALAVMGNRAMRQSGATDELAAYIAYLLAISPKSRLACDLLSIADYNRSLHPLQQELVRAPAIRSCELAQDRSAPLAHRMSAAWLLAGTARFRGVTMPKVVRPRTDFMQLIARSRMPLMLYYVADRAAGRLGDAMFVSSFLMSEMIVADPDILMVENVASDTAMIAGFPAIAFDLHTREGRLALSHFSRECRPVAELLRSVGPMLRDTAIRHAVFIVEGGFLRRQLSFEAANAVERDAHGAELAFAGLKDPERQAALIRTVRECLPELNWMRFKLAGRQLC